MPTLHFIRHGETDWNRDRRIQGHSDVALNARGHEQARNLAAELATRPIGALYSSDLRRALETAEPLAERLGLAIRVAPALRERNFGAHEGRTDEDVAEELGDDAERFWRDPDARATGGESRRDVYVRVAAFVDDLLAEPPADEIALISSGGPIRLASVYLARAEMETMAWQEVRNCSVTTVAIGPGRTTR